MGPQLTRLKKLELQQHNGILKSYDIVGDIVIIRVPSSLTSQSRNIADDIMQNNDHVRTVLRQINGVSGDLRLRRLEWIIGEKKTETLHKEFGCLFKVDLAKCYFSPRLSFERMRVARLVQPGEIVANMFAGVGTFSILIAKYGKADTVYSIDINPSAIKFMRENIRLNRVQSQVIPILGEAKQATVEQLAGRADRVVMPLPEKAYEYLNSAVMALKHRGGCIHYYDFTHASKDESPVEKVKSKIDSKLRKLDLESTFSTGRVVRSTGPNWHQVVLDLKIRP
jgi:tRNA (guanine37-N1)-methyltransferase